MLGRALDRSYPPEVRSNVTLLAVARLMGNSAYRYLVPFLAVVAKGMDVSISDLGIALTIGELAGLTGSFVGRAVDRWPRPATLAGGSVTVAAGVGLVATAHGLPQFAAGLVTLGIAKIAFDIALLSWIADRVPLAQRGRVIGLTEMSWAASLFIGVAIMGAITAIWGWRWAYGAIAVAIVALGLLLWHRLPPDPGHHEHAEAERHTHGRITGHGVRFIVGMGLMMLSSTLMFVVLGPWLEDTHGFSAGGITAVVFGLGVIELVSSAGAVQLTDRWGGRRSVFRGSSLILPAAVLFTVFEHTLPIGLFAMALMALGFEYAIISAASVATTLVPGSPAAGIGIMIMAGTCGRAGGSWLGTHLYDHHGAGSVSAVAAGTALVMVGAFRWAGQQPASPGSIGRT